MSYLDREYPPLTAEEVRVMRELDEEVGRLRDEADAQDAETIEEATRMLDDEDLFDECLRSATEHGTLDDVPDGDLSCLCGDDEETAADD